MLRSWDFLNHGDERINPILRHPEQGPINSSLRNITLCHPELVSGSSHSKTLGSTQNEKVVARSMGQMPKQVRHDIMWGRKAAFTLAEVLITLGIIGVVAAMTLPTLISNYQKKAYVTQLKKSYAVMSNGFKLMMGHEGATLLSETEAFRGVSAGSQGDTSNNNCEYTNMMTNDCRSLREGFVNVFSGIQFVPCSGIRPKQLNGGDTNNLIPLRKLTSHTCIEFPDGSEVFGYRFFEPTGPRGEDIGGVGFFYVDVNGPKNPNILGRDIFRFSLSNNGVVMPSGSCAIGVNYYCWRTATSSDYKCDTSSSGYGCAGRVLEEDAMNY